MLFSQTTEYTLRAMVALAERPEQPQTTQQIASRTQIPANYLSKLLHTLGKAGLVEAQRGVGGGFRLSRPAGEVSVLEVVEVVEPVPRIRSCPLKLDAHAAQLCPLHRKLDHVLALAEQTFANTTLAELLGDGEQTTPLCDVPLTQVEPPSPDGPDIPAPPGA